VGPVCHGGRAFYDIWGYRHLDGERFSPFVSTLGPENPKVAPRAVCELSSIGSCLAMRANVAREMRITDDYCLVGWCKNARVAGYRVGIHWDAQVNHP
jgi:hypothetical protein